MTTEWFNEVSAGDTNPRHQMDTYVLIRVSKNENAKIMLFKVDVTKRNDHRGSRDLKFHTFETVHYPESILQNAIYHNDAIETEQERFWVRRAPTRKRPETMYSTWIYRTRNYLQVPSLGRVYEYDIERSFSVLPLEYYNVSINDTLTQYYTYTGNGWCFFAPSEATGAPPAPLAPSEATGAKDRSEATGAKDRSEAKQEKKIFIPPMYFNAFVEMAMSKGEECPITMEPLSKECVGAPPCGHLFDKGALKRVLEESGKCPTCRHSASPTDIQTI